MGSSWNGFLPQNDIIKLQWAMLEGCQTEIAAKALSALLRKTDTSAANQNGEEPEEGSWSSAGLNLHDLKAK